MSTGADRSGAAVAAALAALRTVPAFLPELAELVPLVRVVADPRVETAGIFPSGRMVVSPEWFLDLRPGEALFVVAHELMHLSLRTHDRRGGMDHRAVNIAHDYIINDMLAEALEREIPAGGLAMPGARDLSLEELAPRIEELIQSGAIAGSFRPATRAVSALGAALGKAGLAQPSEGAREGWDVLDKETERDWFPGEPVEAIDLAETRVRDAALRAVSLDRLRRALNTAFGMRGTGPGGMASVVEALQTAYRPPWHEALQTWMEAVAPSERTYVRPSRRGADRTDLVLPGRKREGWTLHLILDTSGSMVSEQQRVLGAIASFCESVNVSLVRILQCDAEVTRDELVEVETLRRFTVAGFGGSDMSPAMWRLALDPEVDAAIVITDGYIAYPADPMPYAVLWAVTQPYFQPPYGRVVPIDRG